MIFPAPSEEEPSMRSGTEENLKNNAATTNAIPKQMYGVCTAVKFSVDSPEETPPKMAKETITGPIVVPTLLIPPAMLKRMFPLDGSPIWMARGLAAICCKANPSPTMNNPEINMINEALLEAGINNKVPTAEMMSPNASPFLYPILFRMSFFNSAEIAK